MQPPRSRRLPSYEQIVPRHATPPVAMPRFSSPQNSVTKSGKVMYFNVERARKPGLRTSFQGRLSTYHLSQNTEQIITVL